MTACARCPRIGTQRTSLTARTASDVAPPRPQEAREAEEVSFAAEVKRTRQETSGVEEELKRVQNIIGNVLQEGTFCREELREAEDRLRKSDRGVSCPAPRRRAAALHPPRWTPFDPTSGSGARRGQGTPRPQPRA